MLLCTSGEAQVDEDGAGEVLRPGRAVWVPASTTRVCLQGLDGTTVFRTRVGDR